MFMDTWMRSSSLSKRQRSPSLSLGNVLQPPHIQSLLSSFAQIYILSVYTHTRTQSLSLLGPVQMEISHPSFVVAIVIQMSLGLNRCCVCYLLSPSLCFSASLSCAEATGVWAALRIHYQLAELWISHNSTEKVPPYLLTSWLWISSRPTQSALLHM